MNRRILFLSWESPWPAHSGASLRTLGLLTELSKVFEVELITLTRQPLSSEQKTFLQRITHSVIRLSLNDTSLVKKIRALSYMAGLGYPYHSAILESSLAENRKIREYIIGFPGIVLTSVGHWGALARRRHLPNWILNQCDADVEFWRVYASQISDPLMRLAANLNYRLAQKHFPEIYFNVGRIISVCEEDRQHTLALAPQARVDVIENGVDCSYLVPNREIRVASRRLLFTGTSAARNMSALHGFSRNVLPLIRSQIPDVELLVGGNFSSKAQAEFVGIPNIRFSGRVDDMRPLFNQSDIFVAPFEETHGSKLKIAEAMAMGMPIVSSPQGIRGFPLTANDSVLIANNSEEFSTSVLLLMNNPELCFSLGQKARQIALATIDWSILGNRLVAIIEDEWSRLQALGYGG